MLSFMMCLAPHVTGAIALMLSAKPTLTYENIRTKLMMTAYRPPATANDLQCGKASNGSNENYPNNAFGYGRIDVKMATV
jgi:hypothetical protein